VALEDLYQEIILDHYKKPRHPGRLEGAQVEVRHYNPVCGDELTVGLRVEGDRIAGIAVDALGCSISQASASVMTEQVLDRTIPEVLETAEVFRRMMHAEGEADEDVLGDGIAFQGVARYPVRVKCALLGWMALKDAVARAAAGDAGGETAHHTDLPPGGAPAVAGDTVRGASERDASGGRGTRGD
jgi:nitrogen fixation NifU-like protein